MGIDATVPLSHSRERYEKITIPGLDGIDVEEYLD